MTADRSWVGFLGLTAMDIVTRDSPRRHHEANSTSPTPRAGSSTLAARLLSIAAVASVMVALWVFVMVPASMRDPDIWWHLRDVSVQLQQHTFLTRDLFSFTALNDRWINHEWLAEILFFFAWKAGGETGVYLLSLVTIEAIFLGVFYLSFRSAQRLMPSAIATIIGITIATVSFGPRTLLFGWLLLVIEMVLINLYTSRPRMIYWLPIIFMLWINMHGSWMMGLALYLVFLLSGLPSLQISEFEYHLWSPSQLRSLCVVFVLCCMAIFINPYGWNLVLYPLDLALNQKLNVANVEEWLPLNFQTVRGFILLGVLATLFITQMVTKRTWRLDHFIFSSIGIYTAVMHTRFLFLAAILTMPVLAQSLAAAMRQPTHHRGRRSRPVLNALLIVSALLIVIVRLGRPVKEPDGANTLYPEKALSYLEQHPLHGNLFNEFLWGGYLEYHLGTLPVFIDSRVDIFERRGVLRDYLGIIHLDQSLTLLAKYNIRLVLFEKNTPLVYLLLNTGQWQSRYDDGQVILLERIS